MSNLIKRQGPPPCALLLAPLLFGCMHTTQPAVETMATPSAQAPLPPPSLSSADAKKLVLSNRGKMWKDPDSLRNLSVGDPFTCPALRGTQTCICIEANARNSYGGYGGLKLYVATIEGGSVQMEGEFYGAREECGRMTPFPTSNRQKS